MLEAIFGGGAMLITAAEAMVDVFRGLSDDLGVLGES